MQIRVLGCSGSLALGHHTTSFLVDDDLLLDMGSGVGSLSVPALQRINQVLLTHAHLDHVLALPLLADVVMRHRQERGLGPIQVHAPAATIQTLRDHLFNDALWPDFTRLPHPDAPVLTFSPVEVGQRLTLGDRLVQVLPARHSVPAVGYALWSRHTPDAPVWGFSGDTGPNPELAPILRQLRLRDWVLEVAFADRDEALAAISGHHCPSTLMAELAPLDPSVRVHLTHVKPGETEAVQADLARLGVNRALRLLQVGDEFTL